MERTDIHNTAAPDVICVPERGHVELDAEAWTRLHGNRAFELLISRGIVSVSMRSKGRVRLHGSCFVGRAVCGDVVLELSEKVDGALRSLLIHASYDAFRIEHTSAPASDLGSLMSLLVHQFVNTATEYASRGREFQYSTERRVGSLVGGRLDMTRTIQFRARGLGHLLVFDKNVASHITSINQVVLAALSEIERIARLVAIDAQDVAHARGLAMLFSDCRSIEVLFGRRDSLLESARALLDSRLEPRLKDLVALASVVLARESFECASATPKTVPRCWFINLESLFESAVRKVLARSLDMEYSVSRGGEGPIRIFSQVGEHTAHPDLVVRMSNTTIIVGDVKYKNWDASANASDIYQLLVHSKAFGAKRSCLIYPGDRFDQRCLGTSVTGSTTWLFCIDVNNLERDIRKIADALTLPLRPFVEADSVEMDYEVA